MLLHQICVLSLLGAIASYMNMLQFGKLPCLKTQANQHSCPQVPFPQQNKFIGTSPLGTLLSGDLKIGGRTMFLQSCICYLYRRDTSIKGKGTRFRWSQNPGITHFPRAL